MEVISPKELNYPIYVYEEPVAFFCEQLKKTLTEQSRNGKTLIITDSEVDRHYHESIHLWCENDQVYSYVIPTGENSKSIEVASKIWSFMATQGFHRKDLIIAFGGGVVGDLSGFIASTYMRGIKWIQVPTTLLSQIDSSVGGKVAINLHEGKNLIGSFYNPESVWICTAFLNSLSDEIFRDGLGEMFKYGYLADHSILEILDGAEKALAEKTVVSLRDVLQAKMTALVTRCIHIKLAIVLKDFTETRERKYLNLGHTIGHAIESHEAYAISHGHGVMLGIWWIMQLCASLQVRKNDYFIHLISAHERRMAVYEFDHISSLDLDQLLAYIKMDKKAKADEVEVVLFKEPCTVINPVKGQLSEAVDAAINLKAIDYELTLSAVERGFKLESVPNMIILEKLKEIQDKIKSNR